MSAAARAPVSGPTRAAWIASMVLLVLMLATILATVAHAGEPKGEVRRLTAAILGKTPVMSDLRELTDRIGGRISGTPACEAAIRWAVAKFRDTKVDEVATEPFTVPTAWAPRAEIGRAHV